MTVKDEIHQLIDGLDDAQTLAVLDYLHRLSANGDSLTTEQLTEAVDDDAWEIRDSKPFTMDDPLWDIVGIGRSEGPTDVSENVDHYLAEAYYPNERR